MDEESSNKETTGDTMTKEAAATASDSEDDDELLKPIVSAATPAKRRRRTFGSAKPTAAAETPPTEESDDEPLLPNAISQDLDNLTNKSSKAAWELDDDDDDDDEDDKANESMPPPDSQETIDHDNDKDNSNKDVAAAPDDDNKDDEKTASPQQKPNSDKAGLSETNDNDRADSEADDEREESSPTSRRSSARLKKKREANNDAKDTEHTSSPKSKSKKNHKDDNNQKSAKKKEQAGSDTDGEGKEEDDDSDSQTESRRSSPRLKKGSNKVESKDKGDANNKAKADNNGKAKRKQPARKELLRATEKLYAQVEDKLTFTVLMINKALEEEFGVQLSPASKKIVRNRLSELISQDEDHHSDKEDAVSAASDDGNSNGSNSSSEDERASSSDEEEPAEEEPSSEYDEEDDKPKKRRAPATKKKKKKATKSTSSDKPRTGRRKSARKSAKSKKTAELHAAAEKLRQKRMQELRVRNEELQLEQSKEDRKRAELIAAKFETNTDELRLQRLEDRLDLLQKLDQKRMQIIEVEDMPEKQHAKIVKEEQKESPADAEKEEAESDDSDDDMELEIDGVKDTKQRLFPSFNKSAALAVLDFADKASPLAKKGHNTKRNFLASLRLNSNKHQTQLSPTRNVNARAMLRNKLLKKQCKRGNMWLARELGYKNEKAHLLDCIEAEKKKRDMVLQRETERLAANERTQMRERLRAQVVEGDDEEEAELEVESPKLNSGDSDEEAADDEEMMLAKQLEKEQATEKEESGVGMNDTASMDSSASQAEQGIDGAFQNSSGGGEASQSTNPDADVESSKDATNETPQQAAIPPATTCEKFAAKDDESMHDDSFPDAQADELPEVGVDLGAGDSQPEANNAAETFAEQLGEDFDSQPQAVDTQPALQSVPKSDATDTHKDATKEFRKENDGTQQIDTQAPGHNSAINGSQESVDQQDTQFFDTQAFDAQQLDTQAPPPASDKALESQPNMSLELPTKDKESLVTGEDGDGALADTDDENELDVEENTTKDATKEKPKKDRNAGWKAMLQKEAKKLQKQKKRRAANDFLETEADEEEEEAVAGLEDFGFSVHKKKEKEDDEDAGAGEFTADDLKHVVDDLSDDEGDEEKGDKMRRLIQEKEEQERHKEMLRRMREGYDGRRGGIAGGGVGARGIHRFDQLVAADNREGAKELGLLNDDELDSEDEGKGKKDDAGEEEDETALLDKMLKDRFLHRSSVDLEENFSEDEEEEDDNEEGKLEENDEDDKEQDRLAKRFAKRARMQRLMDEFGDDEEFTSSRLIEEDSNMKEELSQMKNGLARKRSISSASRTSSAGTSNSGSANEQASKRQKTQPAAFGNSFQSRKGNLSLALQSGRQHTKRGRRTSFLGNSQSSNSQDIGTSSKSISFSHVVFQTCGGGDSQLSRGLPSNSNSQKCSLSTSKSRKGGLKTSSKTPSLWSKVMVGGSQKGR